MTTGIPTLGFSPGSGLVTLGFTAVTSPTPLRRAVIVIIADAVVDALNSATLSQDFTAVRYYVPVRDLKDLTNLTVSVVPVSLEGNVLNRARLRNFEYAVDIGIQKVIGRGPMTNDEINDEVDPLMLLVQEIVDLFNAETLEGYDVAESVKIENNPIYIPQHMDEKRVFTSVITLTFAVVR